MSNVLTTAVTPYKVVVAAFDRHYPASVINRYKDVRRLVIESGEVAVKDLRWTPEETKKVQELLSSDETRMCYHVIALFFRR